LKTELVFFILVLYRSFKKKNSTCYLEFW